MSLTNAAYHCFGLTLPIMKGVSHLHTLTPMHVFVNVANDGV